MYHTLDIFKLTDTYQPNILGKMCKLLRDYMLIRPVENNIKSISKALMSFMLSQACEVLMRIAK